MSVWKKRVLRGVLLSLLLTLVCGCALALTYPFLSKTTDSVRMRRSASATATVLETIPAGAQVEVLGKTGSFYQVRYDGRKGYVKAEFVVSDADQIVKVTAEPMETVSSYPYNTVTRDTVNLRAGRSVRSELLKKIPQGAEIIVNLNGGTWAEVEYNGISGYVQNQYIVLKEVKKVVRETPTPTPLPTLSPEESEAEYVILEKGSEGAEVKALQNALLQLGYLKGTADGKFGAATENAVLLFQQQNGYPTTGIMDANTQAFLYSGKPKNASGKAEKVTQVSPVAGATMKQHNTGDEVSELQLRLQALGFYEGEVSGTFNLETKKAVIAFQKKNGLTADGVAGADTQRKLWAMDALGKSDTPTPKPTATPTPAPTYTIPAATVRPGSAGDSARAVQERLKELGYYKGTVDGKFTGDSVAALKAFQEAHGLQADGVAGAATYATLFSNQALKKGTTPTPAPTAEPLPGEEEGDSPAAVSYETLRKGTFSSQVGMMQQLLIELGYLSGEPDGNYGTETEKAVRAFQKNNGLGVDGTAGILTLTKMYSSEAVAATATAVSAAEGAGTATAKPAATATPAPDDSNLKKGSSGSAVKAMQEQLIKLGYLTGKADGKFGAKTYAALVAFQKANRLTADGIAGAKTQAKLGSGSAVAASGGGTAVAAATAAPVKVAAAPTGTPTASRVQYANWYTTVKDVCKAYPYATVYDYETGISWQVHIFSVGAHGDYEPLTANDTSRMLKVFGGNTWNPRAVWVVFANGSVYMGSTHSMPHGVNHRTDNNFEGQSCLHFPRTQAQVEAIGVYATSHQSTIDAGWAKTQAMK